MPPAHMSCDLTCKDCREFMVRTSLQVTANTSASEVSLEQTIQRKVGAFFSITLDMISIGVSRSRRQPTGI